MQIRKQYSLAYQVLELTDEVENLEQADLVSTQFDSFAKVHLKEMVDLVTALQPSQNATAVVVSRPTAKPISEKQAGTIKKQFARCKGIAEGLGITLNSESDVDNLSSADGSKIIQAMFGNKSTTGF